MAVGTVQLRAAVGAAPVRRRAGARTRGRAVDLARGERGRYQRSGVLQIRVHGQTILPPARRSARDKFSAGVDDEIEWVYDRPLEILRARPNHGAAAAVERGRDRFAGPAVQPRLSEITSNRQRAVSRRIAGVTPAADERGK